MSPMNPQESFAEQAHGSHLLLGTVLIAFGVAAVLAAAASGLVFNVNPGFLTSGDIALIGAAMLVLGTWLRSAARRTS